jgi:electron transfer flavoprotein alpha/beta subunit
VKIAVFIKQVPDTTDVKIDPKTNTLVREGVASITNPFDEYAVEEAVRLKERFPGTVTYVVTMGPPQAETMLRECLARGIDKAVLVSDRAFAGADTLATSNTLAGAIKKIGDYSYSKKSSSDFLLSILLIFQVQAQFASGPPRQQRDDRDPKSSARSQSHNRYTRCH